MENCFITKLKGVVNNDKIDKLGELTLWMAAQGTNTTLRVSAVENNVCTIRTADGENFYNKTTNVVGITTSLTGFDRVNAGLCIISNKYKLKAITYDTAGLQKRNKEYDVPISTFNYTTNLDNLGVGVYGNLEDLILYTLKALTCQYCLELYGDIKYLINFDSLSELMLSECTNITGKVEDYVAGNVFVNNITTKSFTRFRLGHTQVTWLGASINSASGLSWTPNSLNNTYTDITYLSTTTTIVVNNDGTWSYVNADKSQYVG